MNITLSYRIYNLVTALTHPLSDQRLPYPNPDKKTLLGWELRDQVLDQPLACFFLYKSQFVVMAFDTNKTLQFLQKISTPKFNILQLKCTSGLIFKQPIFPFFPPLFYFIHNYHTLNLVFTTNFCRDGAM